MMNVLRGTISAPRREILINFHTFNLIRKRSKVRSIIFFIFILLFVNITSSAQINSLVSLQRKREILNAVKNTGSFFDFNNDEIPEDYTPVESYNRLFSDSIILIQMYKYDHKKAIDRKDFLDAFDDYFGIDTVTNQSYFALSCINNSYRILGVISPTVDGTLFLFKVDEGVNCLNTLVKVSDNFILWSTPMYSNYFVFIDKELYAILEDGTLLPAHYFFALFSKEELRNRFRKPIDRNIKM